MTQYRILMAAGAGARDDLENSMNTLASEGWTVKAVVPGSTHLPIIIMESAVRTAVDLRQGILSPDSAEVQPSA